MATTIEAIERALTEPCMFCVNNGWYYGTYIYRAKDKWQYEEGEIYILEDAPPVICIFTPCFECERYAWKDSIG